MYRGLDRSSNSRLDNSNYIFFPIFIAVSEVSEKVYQGSRNGTYMTVSKVTLMTSASDDGAVIKCRASHPALVTGAIYPHLEDAVNLTIYCKSRITPIPEIAFYLQNLRSFEILCALFSQHLTFALDAFAVERKKGRKMWFFFAAASLVFRK